MLHLGSKELFKYLSLLDFTMLNIYNNEIKDEIVDNIVDAVRSKKRLFNLDKNLIVKEIEKYLVQNPSIISYISNPKSKKTKAMIKNIRAKFHDIYEIFQTNSISKRDNMLDKLELSDIDSHINILKTHISSKERIPFYAELYEKIFSITGKAKSVLDLSCGLNPLSFPFMKLPLSTRYFATELCEDDLLFIEKYFQKINLKNYSVIKMNLVNEFEKLKDIRVDLCFIFKVIDILETQKKHITYKLLESINAPFVVASFSMSNVKGERMRRDKVHFFERMCRNLNYSFDIIEEPNELFYVVNKKIK